ncbi:response regulator transcription factor [Anaerolineae bacterium CFX7]|nr:response regulator transcription factor [Anaerolineae bacterium CFX7]
MFISSPPLAPTSQDPPHLFRRHQTHAAARTRGRSRRANHSTFCISQAPSCVIVVKGIVILVAQGCTNREIAKKLGLAEQTARNHVGAIYSKTKVKNRVGLTALALRAGLIDSAREK